MSPLALCDNCPDEFHCVEEGCEFYKRAGPQVITLNEEQWDDFVRKMNEPRTPTPAMIEAARKMRDWANRPGDLEYESWNFK